MSNYTSEDFENLPKGTEIKLKSHSENKQFLTTMPDNKYIVYYGKNFALYQVRLSNVLEIVKPEYVAPTGYISQDKLRGAKPRETFMSYGKNNTADMLYLGMNHQETKHIFASVEKNLGGSSCIAYSTDTQGNLPTWYFCDSPVKEDDVTIVVDGITRIISRSSAKTLNLI